jgi:hypothetical protein
LISAIALLTLLPSVFAVAFSICPIVINDSSTLSANLQFGQNGACITFGQNNISLNCLGNSITYGVNASNSTAIVATDRVNVTLQNCTIIDTHAGGTGSQLGVNFTRVNGSTIINNTIQSNSSSDNWAVWLSRVLFTNVTNNSIFGSSNASIGVAIESIEGSANNTIRDNIVRTDTDAGNSNGIRLTAVNNHVIANNTLTVLGSSGANRGIHLFSLATDNNTIANNTIYVVGLNSNGIRLFAASNNNINNNFVSANGTIHTSALYLETSHLNTFTGNNLTTNTSTTNYGIVITLANHSTFSNNVLFNPGQWINSTPATLNNFTNTTFRNANGAIRHNGTFGLNRSATEANDITQAKLNTTTNRANLNSSNLSFLNQSAEITFFGLSLNDPSPVSDFDDDSTFIACTNNICSEVSYSTGTYVFTVTQFTGYSSQESRPSTCPITINVSSTLNGTLSDGVPNAACITFGSNNLELECQGQTIQYGVNGTPGENSTGVLGVDRTNLTVKNCTIVDINESGLRGYGINFTRVNNSLIANNTIQNNQSTISANALLASVVLNSLVLTNTIVSQGSAAPAAVDFDGSYNNTFRSNTVYANATGSNLGIAFRLSPGGNTLVEGNTMTAVSLLGFSIVIDILFTGSDNNTIVNNTLIAGGENSSHGISIAAGINNNVSNNNLRINGTTHARGISLEAPSTGNLFHNNNISTTSTCTNCYGIVITLANNSRFNTTTLTDPGQWMNTTGNTFNNFTNTTFEQPNGSIRHNGTVFFNGTTGVQDVTKAKLNITNNRAFLNSSNLSFLNTSAVVALRDTGFSDPRPTVDFDDDLTFTTCNEPQCVEIGLFGPVYHFSVASFTGYGTESSPIFGSGGAGGGGGGGGVSRANTYSLNTNPSTFSLKKNDKISFSVNKVLHLVTIIEVLASMVRVQVSSTPQQFTIAKGATQNVDVTGDGKADIAITVVNIAYYQATIKVELLGAAALPPAECVESWACEGWTACTGGTQTRTCTDMNACGTTKLKPATQQSCTAEPAMEQPPAEALPETQEEEFAPIRDQLPIKEQKDWTTTLFYALAIIALAGLGAYWYSLSHRKK